MAKAKTPETAVFRTVAVDAIVADPRNYNRQNAETAKKLVASVRRFGCVDPLVVRENPDGNGGYMLIGGEHRLRACIDVGLTQVPIMDVGAMDDAKAHLLMIALNETKGSPDQDALSALVKEIKEYDEMMFADLPLNDAQLADLLDADDDVPVDDEDDGSGGIVATDEKPAKLKAADVGNALEIQGASQSDIARLLTAIRVWRVKQTDEAPAWRLLIDVLEGK